MLPIEGDANISGQAPIHSSRPWHDLDTVPKSTARVVNYNNKKSYILCLRVLDDENVRRRLRTSNYQSPTRDLQTQDVNNVCTAEVVTRGMNDALSSQIDDICHVQRIPRTPEFIFCLDKGDSPNGWFMLYLVSASVYS
uniref:Uncharacterized protein n=1 Tax=Glossina palpalis gambiensis TaxID=67801 RepID=A0A1B0BW49_9MUSC